MWSTVGARRFELRTSRTRTVRASRTALRPELSLEDFGWCPKRADYTQFTAVVQELVVTAAFAHNARMTALSLLLLVLAAVLHALSNALIKLFTEPDGDGQLKATITGDAMGNFYTTTVIDFGTGLYPVVFGMLCISVALGRLLTTAARWFWHKVESAAPAVPAPLKYDGLMSPSILSPIRTISSTRFRRTTSLSTSLGFSRHLTAPDFPSSSL